MVVKIWYFSVQNTQVCLGICIGRKAQCFLLMFKMRHEKKIVQRETREKGMIRVLQNVSHETILLFFSQIPKRFNEPIFETNLEQCALKGAYKY